MSDPDCIFAIESIINKMNLHFDKLSLMGFAIFFNNCPNMVGLFVFHPDVRIRESGEGGGGGGGGGGGVAYTGFQRMAFCLHKRGGSSSLVLGKLRKLAISNKKINILNCKGGFAKPLLNQILNFRPK